MLIINSLKLKYNETVPHQKDKRIRISFMNNVNVTKKRPIENQGKRTIQWQQNLSFPIYFNQQITFEIFSAHQFGYNPQQINSILTGKFKLQSFKEFYKETEVYNKQNNKVGKLDIKFQIQTEKIMTNNQQQPIQVSSTGLGQIIISSILVHIRKNIGQMGYIEIKSKSVEIFSSENQIINNQLVWLNDLNMTCTTDDLSSGLKFCLIVDGLNLAECQLQVKNITVKPIKNLKINMLNERQQKVAILFVNLHYKQTKNNKQTTKFPKISNTPVDSNSRMIYSKSQKMVSKYDDKLDERFKLVNKQSLRILNRKKNKLNVFNLGDKKEQSPLYKKRIDYSVNQKGTQSKRLNYLQMSEQLY